MPNVKFAESIRFGIRKTFWFVFLSFSAGTLRLSRTKDPLSNLTNLVDSVPRTIFIRVPLNTTRGNI
jgi:hypothetical protein